MAAAKKRTIPIIVGPTAVGKTDLAVSLAARWPIVVISADSRQTYRGLDIGTAKPDADVLAAVKHLGIDIVEPGERYSAGRFAADAADWIEAAAVDHLPVVVGGTGFYVKALVDGLLREPDIERALVEQIGRAHV